MKGKEKEQLYQKRNYDHYRFSMKELLKYMGQALALCIMADYLFYRSVWVLLLAAIMRLPEAKILFLFEHIPLGIQIATMILCFVALFILVGRMEEKDAYTFAY